jgi:hypothetical protein
MTPGDDEFLSGEDNDLANLSEAELWAWWNRWFQAAQVSNADDQHLYSHGVFTCEPGFEDLAERRRFL